MSIHQTKSDLTRRSVLASTAGAGAMILAACSTGDTKNSGGAPVSGVGKRVLATDSVVQQVEDKRASNGRRMTAALVASPLRTTLAGQAVTTWGYDNRLPGRILRARVGDTLSIAQHNRLTEPTSVHFHGLALRNDADGVAGLTQAATAPGNSYTATFKTTQPGTFWYHPHVELQRERALYGPLIIDDPQEPLKYDAEWVLMLDDWLDGIDGRTPKREAASLARGMTGSGMSGMGAGDGTAMPGMSGTSAAAPASPFLGGDGGDVIYPVHLINGRSPADPEVFTAKPGQRMRLRIINAAGDTAYRIGIPGVPLTITHTDGYPVTHRQADAVVLGMGERIDALITVPSNPVPLMSLAEGKTGSAFAVLAAGPGARPTMSSLPKTLTGTVIESRSTTADPSVRLPSRAVDIRHTMRLTGGMGKYDWGINGRRFDMKNPYASAFNIRAGQRVQLEFVNNTMMWHPMHLHGHTFQVGSTGPRKDTVIVKPMERVSVFFDADNPGQWLTHCHNAYHAERGMMAVVSYLR